MMPCCPQPLWQVIAPPDACLCCIRLSMAGQITRYPKPEPEKPEPEPEPEKTKPEKPEHYFG